MNMLEMVVVAVVGTGLIAGISLAVYARLPWTALESAARNGRYSGLGTPDQRIDHPPGRRPVTVGSLQSHSA